MHLHPRYEVKCSLAQRIRSAYFGVHHFVLRKTQRKGSILYTLYTATLYLLSYRSHNKLNMTSSILSKQSRRKTPQFGTYLSELRNTKPNTSSCHMASFMTPNKLICSAAYAAPRQKHKKGPIKGLRRIYQILIIYCLS